MPRFNRLHIVALGLALLVTLNGCGQAEDEQGESQQPTEQTEEQVTPFGVPVRIVETPAEEDSRRQEQQEAAQREQEDLAAQQGMERATREMADYAFWQTVFVGMGTLLVIGTLYLMIQANNAAQEAVKVTREIGNRQTRAYLSVNGASIEDMPGRKGFALTVQIINSGQTPAFKVRHMSESLTSSYPLDPDYPHPVPPDDFGTIIGAGQPEIVTRRIWITEGERLDVLKEIKAGKTGLWIHGTFIYNDCFGGEHFLKYRFVCGGRLAESDEFVLHADAHGNEAD